MSRFLAPGAFWLALLRGMKKGRAPFRDTELVILLRTGFLNAFLDESGNHDGARFFALAGFIASPKRWGQFESAWETALARARPPVAAFHGVNFFRGKGPLSRSRRACLDDLLQAVADSQLFPVGAIVDLEAFKALPYGERRFISGASVGADDYGKIPLKFAKPYFLAFHHCVAQAAKQTKDGKKANIVFGPQSEYDVQAQRLVAAVREKLPPDARQKIGTCTFAFEDVIVRPLEAADLLAHCWFAHMQYGKQNRPDREDALNRLMAKTGSLHRYGAKDFETLLAPLSSGERAQLRAEAEPG